MKNPLIVTMIKEIKQRRWAILTYSLIAVFFLWMYVALYPSIASQTANIEQLYKSFPKGVLKAFNIDLLDPSFAGFLASKHMDFVWPLMAILLGLSTAGVALAGEIEHGTMAMLLSLPLSRKKLYTAKYLGGAKVLAIFTVLSILPTGPLAAMYHVDVSQANVVLTALLSWVFAMAIFSIAFMISALVKERGTVYFITGGLLLGMYVARVLSGLVDSLAKLKYASFFYYYEPAGALTKGHLSLSAIAVFLGTTIICFLIGLIGFNRRDIHN